jgi:hypothetical protein
MVIPVEAALTVFNVSFFFWLKKKELIKTKEIFTIAAS